jgi:wyosine [tRNA(Phe)-imidazoG37] synthetase (radical SAM superfamily)
MNIAVITNSSLLSDKQVRDDLQKADWVSLKIDAVSHDIWKNINRPHGSLQLSTILEGIVDFSHSFNGYLSTETMLINHTNDTSKELEKIAGFLHALQPNKSYISIPTRPPAEPWAQMSTEKNLAKAYHIFVEHNIPTEYLIGYEGNAFSSTGDLVEDILSITAVHPLREEGINELLKKTGEGWEAVEDLLKEKKIIEIEHKNKKFYLRNLQKRT